MNDNQDIIRKIKACLARAAGTDSENERATAMRQAQKMMEEHGIDEYSLRLADVKSAKAQASSVQRLKDWEMYLVQIVIRTFATDAVFHCATGRKTETQVEFIGFGCGPELSAYTYEVLLRKLKKDRTEYLGNMDKRLKKTTKTRRADLFALAWVDGAQKNIVKLRPSTEQKRLLEGYKNQAYGELQAQKARDTELKHTRGDHAAVRAGLLAGSEAQLNHGVGAAPDKHRIERCKNIQ